MLLGSAQAQVPAATTIRQVAVLGSGGHLELEITASQAVVPQAQTIPSPDRLILDFPNATPGPGLRNVQIGRGELKGVRVGLFASNPPVTRVVLDLSAPLQYQLFPSGKTIIVKLKSGTERVATPATPVTEAVATHPVISAPPAAPPARVRVEFQRGDMSIWADKATLAEVLTEIHRKTGAEVPIPNGAEQEQVAADFRMAPARDVLAALLNGSRFNFVLVGSEQDPTQLRSVLLSPRGAGKPSFPARSAPEEPSPAVEEYVPEAPAAPPDIPAEPAEQINIPVPPQAGEQPSDQPGQPGQPPPQQPPPDQPQQ
jgi:hypothetical protein